ncbi:MAG: hypothetical protein SFY80_15295 [Verrucomicrobiota bacterium]|nr:hypothetical protein [Verrucomicrobiota bacterium]
MRTETDTSGDGLFHRKPWLLVVVAFIVLISAWSVLYWVASTNKPALIDTKTPATEQK